MTDPKPYELISHAPTDTVKTKSLRGQAYISATYPGVVKAWHYHKVQVDNEYPLAPHRTLPYNWSTVDG